MQAQAGKLKLTLEGVTGGWLGELSAQSIQDGLEIVRLRLRSDEPLRPPRAKLAWTKPMVDIHARWCTGIGAGRHIPPDFSGPTASRANSGAPVMSLYSFTGRNRLTFALSDPMKSVQMKAHVHEESAELTCSMELFVEPRPPISEYEALLRLDTRDLPYYQVLRDVSDWWASQPGCQPSPVPEPARLPLYSTWYSFHQRLDPREIEKQCQVAKELGCEAVIVDDGWQTKDSSRGYEHCGDWEPLRIPDMREHVARVHRIGMKFVLWYAAPFVGKNSRNWHRFQDKFLSVRRGQQAVGTLDPRFPDVREHLIGVFERAMIDWDVDGFKLDFIDSFRLPPDQEVQLGGGRDCDSAAEAVDRLLCDATDRLRKIKPDVMIEFRQSYVGPLMRKYGNMFRAGDCPNDALSNRVRTLDIRLLCGNTAAHSDMLMWHANDPVESAALQIVNVLFSVPQISVLLDKLPANHLEMIRFWLAFWRENRDVLLDGELMPLHPELLYPLVIARTSSKLLAALYGDSVVEIPDRVGPNLVIVNGTLKEHVIIEANEDLGTWFLEIRDCMGHVVQTGPARLTVGLHTLRIPQSGIARLTQ